MPTIAPTVSSLQKAPAANASTAVRPGQSRRQAATRKSAGAIQLQIFSDDAQIEGELGGFGQSTGRSGQFGAGRHGCGFSEYDQVQII
jgi:hypothetical protein